MEHYGRWTPQIGIESQERTIPWLVNKDVCVCAQKYGCVRGEELPYVFGAPLVEGLAPFPKNFTRAEAQLSRTIMTYWTNFVATG